MLGLTPLAARPLAAALEDRFTGSYLLAGRAVTLRVGRKLIAGVGSYAFTGNDVNFPLSSSPTALSNIPLTASSASPIFGFKMSQNFQMTAGDNKVLVVTVKDANGTRVNITGTSIKWQAARSFGKASVISKATGGNGVNITNGPNGVFTVTLLAADTESLAGIYHHEAQITALDGLISTVLFGTMKINKALIEAT